MILGATSAIAQETAKLLAADGDHLFLIARNEDKLKAIVDDLRVRGAEQVGYLLADLADTTQHELLLEQASRELGGIDTVLIAHGTLSDQKACERDFSIAEREFRVNFLSVASLLTHLANRFERQGRGCIAVMSSVAGDRGRKSNYVYGTAKGALTIFLQGLRHRLYAHGVRVLTIKPGFVDTPMTSAFEKGLLWVGPAQVARGIHRAIVRNKDVVYLPWFWRGIMVTIRALPEPVFAKLNI